MWRIGMVILAGDVADTAAATMAGRRGSLSPTAAVACTIPAVAATALSV